MSKVQVYRLLWNHELQETKMSLVRSIMRSDMSDTEKNKQMQVNQIAIELISQAVMAFEYMRDTELKRIDSISGYVSNVDVENGSIDASQVTWNVLPTFISILQNKKQDILGCQHYQRGAKMLCPECHQFFTCRLCHDAACTHSIDRYKVEYMACMYCFRIQVVLNPNYNVQKVAQSCKYCGKVLGYYYCNVCHFWCNNKKIHQFISFVSC